jgi:hypothetical protein
MLEHCIMLDDDPELLDGAISDSSQGRAVKVDPRSPG